MIVEQCFQLRGVYQFDTRFVREFPRMWRKVRSRDKYALDYSIRTYSAAEVPNGRCSYQIIWRVPLALEEILAANDRLIKDRNDVDPSVARNLRQLRPKLHGI